MKTTFLLVSLFSVSLAYAQTPSTVMVSNSSELLAAVRSAKGGETILLKPSSAKYDLQTNTLMPKSEVLITSYDKSNPAVIETLRIQASQNLRFDSLRFDSGRSTRASWLSDIFIERSSNMRISNSVMRSVATRYRDQAAEVGETAVYVADTKGFQFDGNDVGYYNWGLQIRRSDKVVIKNNLIHHLQADGIQIADAQGVLIENNRFTEFLGSLHSLNHTDLIQFYTAGTTRQTRDVIIRKNYFNNLGSSWSQVIFMGNEAVRLYGAGREMYYKNILIEENLIHNNSWQGITLYYSDEAMIKNNAVFLNKDSTHVETNNPGIYIQTAGQVYNTFVMNNISQFYSLVVGTVATNNVTVKTSGSSDPYYAKKLFVDPFAGARSSESSFKILGSSLIANLGVGPSVIQASSTPESKTSLRVWQNIDVPVQSRMFEAHFDAVANASIVNAVAGFSTGPAAKYTDLAAIARFSPEGKIDARNGSGYAASADLTYVRGKKYHFRMVIDPERGRYSVYVTPQGGSEILLANDFYFRSEQASVRELRNFGYYAETQSHSISGFMIRPFSN